jgi:hypothetical protein
MTETNPPRCEMDDPGDKVPSRVRQRRQLLIGSGAMASSITVLWNRPSFGAATACTHSVWRSHLTGGAGFLSQGAVPTSCGDTPACWAKSENDGDWGTYSSTTRFSSTFNMSGCIVNGSGSQDLLAALNGGLTIQSHGSNLTSTDLCAQAVATLLNANWYGPNAYANYSDAGAVINAVNNIFSQNNYNKTNDAAKAFVQNVTSHNNHTC